MPQHPRRALYVGPLVELLRGLEVVGGPGDGARVYDAPVQAIDGRKPNTFPAIAVNPRREPVAASSRETQERTLEVAIVCAGRTLEECDQVANDVEDLVDAQARDFVLVTTEFGAEVEGVERPFFFAALVYSLRYATRRSGG